MSDSATQAHTFFDEVARTRKVWTIRDDGGYPVPRASLGMPARPFWSSLSRVNRILKAVPAYRRFAPEEVSWEAFRDTWVPSLERDGLHVGVNWGGKFA